MLEYGDNRLIARQDVWMNLEWNPSILVVMIYQIDSAIAPWAEIGPSRRFPSLTREETSETSLQFPRVCLEEFDVLRYFHSIPLGDFDRILDGPLQPALVFLPSELGTLTSDSVHSTETAVFPIGEGDPNATKETREEH
jgi:hypothetical protein